MRTSQIKTCWLTVNRMCQLRCRWCYAQDTGYDASHDMAFKTAIRLIDIMQKMGTNTCKILGGEPSLYPHITDVLKHLQTCGIRSVLITNGLRYANKDFMAEHFEAGLDSLIISLKAGTHESYKQYTGADILNRVHQAIRNLADFRGGVTITITEEMLNEIIPALSGIIDAGVRFVNLHFCSPTLVSGTPENHSMLTPGAAADLMTRAVHYLEERDVSYNVQISIPFCLFDTDFIRGLIEKNCLTSGCIVNKKSGIILDTEGEAGFCNHMMKYPFGKLDVDFSTAAQLQKLYLSQDQFFNVTNRAPSGKCLKCPISHICCGGCPLQWTQFNPETWVKGGDAFTELIEKINTTVNHSISYEPLN